VFGFYKFSLVNSAYLINQAHICSWNQPVSSNGGNVSWSM